VISGLFSPSSAARSPGMLARPPPPPIPPAYLLWRLKPSVYVTVRRGVSSSFHSTRLSRTPEPRQKKERRKKSHRRTIFPILTP